MKKFKTYIYFVLYLVVFSSCKKSVHVDPPTTNPVSSSIYTSNSMAAAVLTGVYDRIMRGSDLRSNVALGISLLSGLSADEFDNYSTDNTYVRYYTNSLLSSMSFGQWTEMYQYIYTANAALEGLSNSTGVSSSAKQQLLGEAKFVRAFCYFYLVNLWSDVPLITTTDYRTNATAHRAPKDDVYQLIIKDLKDAETLLSDQYLSANLANVTAERVRPTKWAATALLARVYLYKGDWVNSEAEATKVINNTSKFSLVGNLNNVFLKNSTEAIWQLQPIVPTYNTFDGYTFILTSNPDDNSPVALSDTLLKSFESGDNRKTNWINTFGSYSYAYKYKIKTVPTGTTPDEYLMVLRLAEQFLIRAEARAQQNKISESKSDLNIIRTRAGLSNTTANDKISLLTAILHERQVELFSEWGHRWLDLKRSGKIDIVMNAIATKKGSSWSSNSQLYPIPLTEIQKDPNLTQNQGY